MGFPKSLNDQTQQELYIKYSHSGLCQYLNIKNKQLSVMTALKQFAVWIT